MVGHIMYHHTPKYLRGGTNMYLNTYLKKKIGAFGADFSIFFLITYLKKKWPSANYIFEKKMAFGHLHICKKKVEIFKSIPFS